MFGPGYPPFLAKGLLRWCFKGMNVIKDRIIVCIASAWNYDPTSKHQIMKILAKHNDIVWINYHGTRRPKLCRADLKAGYSVLRRFARGIDRVGPSFVQLTPLVIPGTRNRLLSRLHQKMLIAQIRRAIRSVPRWNEKPIQIWAFAPDVPFLVDQFDEECYIYYCVDDHSHFEGMDPERVAALEDEQTRLADVVVATSKALLDSRRAIRPDTELVRHGVDFERFAAAWKKPIKPPSDLADIPGPIFGFFGLIHFWVDCKLIAEVARRRPQYSFVLIGDEMTDTSELKRLSNVYLLGRRPNEELPVYCASFVAGLLPFVRSDLTQTVNPIKMYEYLAAGLPVVSTPMAEAERYRGPITIAETVDEFVLACDAVINNREVDRRELISRSVENEAWGSKVRHLSQIIQRQIDPVMQQASMPTQQVMPSTQADETSSPTSPMAPM